MKSLKPRIDRGDDIFCIFNNTESTYCRPFPPTEFDDSIFWPELRVLPSYSDSDLPACLHDSLRLKEIWENRGLEVDDEGFVKVNFTSNLKRINEFHDD